MAKTRKRIKKTGVFRKPEELQECFTAFRIIIHSHCYENNPRYEDLVGSLLSILMKEYHDFMNIGIDPMEFVVTEKDEVMRENVLAVLNDIAKKVELSAKLEGKNGSETSSKEDK